MDSIRRRYIDLLVEEFWKQGYLTVSRKYGTYLPEPAKVGEFDVDIIARYKKNYAIGITLSEEDLNDPNLINKIKFLATRQTKFTNKKVMLFIGVESEFYKNAKTLIELFEHDIKKNIKLFQIVEKAMPSVRRHGNRDKILFS